MSIITMNFYAKKKRKEKGRKKMITLLKKNIISLFKSVKRLLSGKVLLTIIGRVNELLVDNNMINYR